MMRGSPQQQPCAHSLHLVLSRLAAGALTARDLGRALTLKRQECLPLNLSASPPCDSPVPEATESDCVDIPQQDVAADHPTHRDRSREISVRVYGAVSPCPVEIVSPHLGTARYKRTHLSPSVSPTCDSPVPEAAESDSVDITQQDVAADHPSRIDRKCEVSVRTYSAIPASSLENVSRQHRMVRDKHGRPVGQQYSWVEVMCRPLLPFCMRRAVEESQISHKLAVTPAADMVERLLRAEQAEHDAEDAESLSARVSGSPQQHSVCCYDEAALFRTLQALNLTPVHVIHLCFWAASRVFLSQPHQSTSAAVGLVLLGALRTLQSDAVYDKQERKSSDEFPEFDPVSAWRFVEEAIVKPFMVWWEGALSAVVRDSCGSSSTSSNPQVSRPVKCRKKSASKFFSSGRLCRRSRVELWQELLTSLCSRSALTPDIECSATLNDSERLVAFLFPEISMFNMESDMMQQDTWTHATPLGYQYTGLSGTGCRQRLAGLLPLEEALAFHVVFLGPTHSPHTLNPKPFDDIRAQALRESGVRLGGSEIDSIDSVYGSKCHSLRFSCPGKNSQGLSINHEEAPIWLSWVIRRYDVQRASL